MEDLKECIKCHKEKILDNFYQSKNKVTGKITIKAVCKACYKEKPSTIEGSKRSRQKVKERRKDPNWHAFFIVRDLKFWDKVRDFTSDLDVDFVQSLIKNGCSYCGENKLRVSLDRIDNEKGHVKDNVVSCCIRCNYFRLSMPHEAWMLLVPGMRRARELGYFDNWLPTVPYLNKLKNNT